MATMIDNVLLTYLRCRDELHRSAKECSDAAPAISEKVLHIEAAFSRAVLERIEEWPS